MRGLDRFNEVRWENLNTVKSMLRVVKASEGQPLTPDLAAAVAECQAFLNECVLDTAAFAAMCRCALLGS